MDSKEISEQIKNDLTIEDVLELILYFGGNAYIRNDVIISQTICHGGDSMKLFYYDNTKLFKCYTHCPEGSFDIFQLVLKVKKNNGEELQLPHAVNFIINFYHLSIETNSNFNNSTELNDWKILSKYEKNSKEKEQRIVEMSVYEKDTLKFFPTPKIEPWLKEGISATIMADYGICYNPVSQGIIIPHYNMNNELVGIRERTLIKEEEVYGKYKPAILSGKMYNHPLGFNLYNLNNSKNNIKAVGKAIVYEGEKSCLLHASIFGAESDVSVAVCGSSLTTYQVDLLIAAGAKEIIIAFDKQFKMIGDEEYNLWVLKLKQIHKKFSPYVQVSFMFDKLGLLEYKSSPIDEGRDKFMQLLNNKVVL